MSDLSCTYVTYLHSTPESVWHALTDAEATATWWGHANVSDWQVGSRWEHRKQSPTGELDGTGEVLESDRPRRLAFTFPSGAPSRVAFDIEPHHDLVRLTLTHSELADETLRSVVASVWAAVLSNLKTYLETGRPLPQSPVGMLGLD
ncbi:SRPBCC family protein [Microlunatus sp. Y2014]|uniref:SRPBCC family protein n=1 Tax=Microlunatus sp. Y2014 TaxID=3418488 RepID=UPI003DA783F1